MKITKEEYNSLQEKVEKLEKLVNGGPGSGNFGHGGRPGEVGGSSKTGARMARGDKVAELNQKYKDARDEYDDYIMHRYQRESEGEKYDDAKAEKLMQAYEKAEKEYDEADRQNQEQTKAEITAGMEKKKGKNTPGKQETARALKEVKSNMETSTRAYDDWRESSGENREKLKEKYDKAYEKTLESGKKLEKAISNQMINDTQFVDDVKEHIEKGLGVKLGKDFKLEVAPYGNVSDKNSLRVVGKTKLSAKDLGAFGKVLSKATIDFDTRMSTSNENLGMMWGRVDLDYTSRGGGGNGQNLFSVNYYPDGTYYIKDERGR